MDASKRQLLDEAYHAVLQIGWYDKPLDELDQYFASDFLFFGTGVDEHADSAYGFREMIARQRSQSESIDFEVSFEPLSHRISDNEASAVFVDDVRVTLYVDGKATPLHVRHTIVFEYVSEAWHAAHIHASVPTDLQAEGDAWPVEAMKRRNAELEKLVAEKTIHLERSIRALEIEASFERVRGKALSIKKSQDLLNVCEVLLAELHTLGIDEIKSTQILIFNDNRESYLNFEFSDFGMHDITEVEYSDHEIIRDFIKDFRKAGDAFSVKEISGDTLVEWRAFRDQVYKKQDTSPEAIDALFYNFYSVGHGVSGVLTFSPLDSDQKEILTRFRSVFDLVYRRYSDLVLAEATQAQLIQAEKMASLGELTAGIAHEIQNPLNFVNNFSELNAELLEEIKEELGNNNTSEANELIDDVIANEQKITHHGKRADAIVKGMLQHSRSSSGVKEPTDINALADEYLRLAYHGLRAKDKTFNATMHTEFDQSIGMVKVAPQDIGRVILNLITNAFHAVAEKAVLLKSHHDPKAGTYQPTVTIRTKKVSGQLEISVEDNGNGIPERVREKIFQPFFTTKPTGKGTGLGLSLSYDIVKAHEGELKLETREGKGTQFIIHLPIQ